MATQNISLTPIGTTYTNANNPNTNYANQSPLLVYGSQSPYGECRAIIQFDVNSEISVSKINTAILNFGVRLTDSASGREGKLYYSSAFTTGYVVGDITHNNFSSLITQGVRIPYLTISYSTSFVNNQIDVTSVVTNNINDGVLTIIIEGYGAWPLQIDPSSISLVINYEKVAEVEPITPVIIAPNGTYENRSNQIKLEWIYKSQTQATQASATIEYRKGTSGGYTTINVYSSNNFYIVSPNTFNTGVYEWRVRTTDTDGKISDYAYSSFTVIDRPSVPLITNIENKCISTTTWSSADQVAFEFEVYKGNTLEFSKKVSSSANNYKPNIFFSNTTYTIRVRVCNIYGLWSEWGNKIVTFTFTNPPKPSIIVTTKNHEVVITSNVVGSIIYKSEDKSEYIPIGKIADNNMFIDYNIADSRMYRYYVRSYKDGYTDSDIQLAKVTIKGVILQNDKGYLNLRLSQNPFMDYNKTITSERVIKKYSGRRYGVVEFGDYIEQPITLSTTLTQEETTTLEELYNSNQVLVYKDFRGNKFYGVIHDINITQITKKYYNVNLTISRVDGSEEVSVYE